MSSFFLMIFSHQIRCHKVLQCYICHREGNGNLLQYSCLETPMDRGAWQAAVHGVAKSPTRLIDFPFIFTFMHWRRKWQPTPVFLPGESQGQWNLVGCRLWGHTESDTTEGTQHSIAFLPRSKCLLISQLQSPSTVLLEPKKIKSVSISTFPPSICHEVLGPDAMIFIF